MALSLACWAMSPKCESVSLCVLQSVVVVIIAGAGAGAAAGGAFEKLVVIVAS